MLFYRFIVFSLFLFVVGPAFPLAAAEVPAIAAAADLKFALAEVAALFSAETGQQLRISFGSSGTFMNQIEHGAPFEIFLSADENFVFRLAERGLTADRGALYAIGQIVLFAPRSSPLTVDAELRGLKSALAAGSLRRFAIANPEHAPYGRAARAALQSAGLWAELEPRLVFGENAAQAMQFAASGSAEGGIVPLSLVMAAEVTELGRFAIIPRQWHAAEPLRQRMVLLKGAGSVSRDFYRYLQTPVVREILAGYGFVTPEGAGD
jgi:molybdate transport system substrate-binding protein